MVGFLRPSDIERIDLNRCNLQPDNILNLVVVSPKEKRKGYRYTKAVTIHPHPNSLLCPVLAFKSYTARVASPHTRVPYPVMSELSITPLFRNQNNHTQAIGSERISKHIQSIMRFVSRPTGTPIPKTRALASTLAAQTGVAVDDIVVHGNWSSRDLFENFYRISVNTSSNFTSATLDSQQRSEGSKCNIM